MYVRWRVSVCGGVRVRTGSYSGLCVGVYRGIHVGAGVRLEIRKRLRLHVRVRGGESLPESMRSRATVHATV